MSNIHDYWQWPNVLNQKKIVEINNYIETNYVGLQNKINGAIDLKGNFKKNSTVKIIEFFHIKKIIPDLIEYSILSAQQNFGYDIFYPRDSENCNLNIYSSKNKEKYDWHIDNSRSELYDIKLTILINISLESYTGGKFYLFNTNEKEVEELNNPGNMIMFKSSINHKVTPITKGERRTLAIFLKGPKFR